MKKQSKKSAQKTEKKKTAKTAQTQKMRKKNPKMNKKSQIMAAKIEKKQFAQKKILSTGVILVGILFFLCCIGILCQRLVITKLDSEVTEKQSEYDDLKALNEGKVGAITGQWGYDEIEALAKSYGMVYPSESQRVTEPVTEQIMDASGLLSNRWYHRLLK